MASRLNLASKAKEKFIMNINDLEEGKVYHLTRDMDDIYDDDSIVVIRLHNKVYRYFVICGSYADGDSVYNNGDWYFCSYKTYINLSTRMWEVEVNFHPDYGWSIEKVFETKDGFKCKLKELWKAMGDIEHSTPIKIGDDIRYVIHGWSNDYKSDDPITFISDESGELKPATETELESEIVMIDLVR